MQIAMKRINRLEQCVVTGGSGFVGSHLLRHLLAEGRYKSIYVLDLVEPRIDDPRITYIKCDIRQPITLQLSGCRILYHLAALAKEPGFAWREYFETNYEGTRNVATFAARNGMRKIVYTSTMMVYESSDERKGEQTVPAPDTAYGASKLLGEEVLTSWVGEERGRSLSIIRAAVIFGRHENGNFTRLAKALKRRMFVYVGRKTTVKSCAYVEDLARFCLWCTGRREKKSVYNFAFPEATMIEEICHELSRVLQVPPPRIVVPFGLALLAGYVFEFLDRARILKSPIHHRRIEKLYYSTSIDASQCVRDGFRFAYSLGTSLERWKNECNDGELS